MLFHSMTTERDRLKQTVDMNNGPTATISSTSSTSLKQTLTEVTSLLCLLDTVYTIHFSLILKGELMLI